MPKPADLDSFDLALLEQVQRDNQIPARLLAERVGLSESAVLRRLRRLRQESVIAGDVAIVRPAALGLPLTIQVLVSLERGGTAELDAFTRKLRERTEIRQAWYVTGEADFILLVQVSGMEAYDGFARTMFNDDPNAKSFQTIVVMREVVSILDAKPLRGAG